MRGKYEIRSLSQIQKKFGKNRKRFHHFSTCHLTMVRGEYTLFCCEYLTDLRVLMSPFPFLHRHPPHSFPHWTWNLFGIQTKTEPFAFRRRTGSRLAWCRPLWSPYPFASGSQDLIRWLTEWRTWNRKETLTSNNAIDRLYGSLLRIIILLLFGLIRRFHLPKTCFVGNLC